MLYVFGALIAALFLVSGFASCEYKQVQTLETSIAANKVIAKQMLDDKIAENAKREAANKAFSITIQGDYEKKLKGLSDANRIYVGRLRDPGRQSSACTGSQASANTGKPQETASGTELSAIAGDFLRKQADSADQLAMWAKSCFDFIKGKP